MIPLFKSVSAKVSTSTQTHLWTALLLESISGLQTIYLLLITIFPASTDRAFRFTELLKQITSVFTTCEILGSGTFSSSATQFICLVFIGYLIILSLSIILLFIIKDTKNNLAQFLSKVFRVHSRVLFFIGQYYFLKFLTNSSQKAPEDITWRWWLVIGYALNLLITVLYEGFFFQRAKIKDAYASSSNISQQLAIAHKLFGLTVYFLVSSLAQNDMATATCVVHIVFTLVMLMNAYIYLPFYNPKIMKMSIVFTSLQFSLAIVLIINAFDVDQYVLEALCMVIPPFLVKMLLTGFCWRSERILRGKTRNPHEAMHFAVLLKQLAFGPAHPSRHLRKVPKDSLVSNGLLSIYQIDIEKGILIDSEKEYKQMVYLYILQVLEEVSIKYPDSISLCLFMAKIYLKRLNNESQALKLIMRVQAGDLSLTESNSLKKFNILMEQLKYRPTQKTGHIALDRLNKGEKQEIDLGNLDVQSYFRAKEITDMIRKDIYQEVSNHLSFWQAVKSDELDVKTLFDVSQKIEALTIKVQKYYKEQLGPLQNYCCASIVMFAVYLHLIREIPEDVSLMKRFMRYLKDSTTRHALDMYSKDLAVIVNSSRGSSDIILSASGSAQTMFQIEGTKLIGKKINYLFPTVFAKQYIDYLYEYTKSLSSAESENKFKTFAKTASGHLFEVEIFFKVYPEISQEMKIMALLKMLPSSQQHLILLSHDGLIIDCDSQVAKDMNIITSDLSRINIQKLCSPFFSINKAFNTVYSNEWEIGSRGTKRNQSQGPTVATQKFHADTLMSPKFHADTLMSPKYPDNYPLMSPTSPTETMPMITFPVMETQGNYKTSGIIKGETMATEQSERQTHKVTYDKAQEMCGGYMEGRKLTFVEYNEDEEDKILKEIEYDVKVEPHVLDGKVYKILRLENPQVLKDYRLIFRDVAAGVALKIRAQKNFQLSERDSQASSVDTPRPRRPIVEIEKKDTAGGGSILVTRLQTTLLNSIEYQEEAEPEGLNDFDLFSEERKEEIMRMQEGIVSSVDSSRASQNMIVVAQKAKKSQVSSKHSSMISARSSRGRSMRALNQALDSKESYNVSFRALVVTYIVIFGLLGLAISNYTYSITAITQIEEELNANNLLNIRLCSAMNAWSQVARMIIRSAQWRIDTQQGITNLQNNVSLYSENLNTDSNNLQRLLASAKTKELYKRMLRRDIVFEINTSSVTSHVGPLNSFIATDLLVNQFIDVTKISYSDFYTAETMEILCNAATNAGNDYLVSSESVMAETQSLLSSVSSQGVLTLKLILAFVFVCFSFFIFAFLVILNSIVMKLQKLFQAIIRTEPLVIDKKILRFEQVKDLFEEDIQNDIFIGNATNLLYQRRPRDKKQQEKLLRSSHKNIKTLGLIKFLGGYLLIAVLLLIILCAFFVEGLINTINSFHSMDVVNSQMSVLSKAQYQSSALSGLLYMDILFHNSSTLTFRDDSLKTQTAKTLEFFAEISNYISDAFPPDENEDQAINDLLNHKMCGYLTNMTLADCYTGTLNNTLNVLTLNSLLYSLSNYYYKLFQGNPTEATGRAIFLVYIRTTRAYVSTLDEAYTFLLTHIIENVNTTVDDFKSMKLVRFIIILTAILVIAVVTQNVTVKVFGKYDKGRGGILKIMGMDVVMESKALIYYIKSEFDEKGTILGSNILK